MQVSSRPRDSRQRSRGNRFRWCRTLAYPPAARRFRPDAYSADDSGRAARRRCLRGGERVARSAGSALVRLRENLLPLAERYGRAPSSAVAASKRYSSPRARLSSARGRRIKDGPVTGDGRNGAWRAVAAATSERRPSDRKEDGRRRAPERAKGTVSGPRGAMRGLRKQTAPCAAGSGLRATSPSSECWGYPSRKRCAGRPPICCRAISNANTQLTRTDCQVLDFA